MMVSLLTREVRGQKLYLSYQAQLAAEGHSVGPEWRVLSGVLRTRWESIASKYHERIENV